MSDRSSNNKGTFKSQKRFVPKAQNPREESTSSASFTTSLRKNQAKTEAPRGDGGGSSGSERVRMAEKGKWVSRKSTGNFVKYLPQDEAVAAGLGVEDGGLDSVESQRVVDLLNRELSRLLKLNARDFWREVANDSSLHEFLDSYLQFRSRWYDFPHHGVKGTVAGVIVGEFELSRRVFMVLYRISSNKDPGAPSSESLSAKEHTALLQGKKLLDLPKMLDICAIYGHDNPELTKSLVHNSIKAQPALLENLTSVVTHFLTIVHTMDQRCSSLLETLASSGRYEDQGQNLLKGDLLEVIDFINDAIVSLDAFVDAYKPAAIYFSYPIEMSYGNEELLTALARIHDSLLPSVHQGLAHILNSTVNPTQNLSGGNHSDIALSFKLFSCRTTKFGWKLVESCYLSYDLFESIIPFVSATKMFPANVEDPSIRGDILVQTFREIIMGISSHLQNLNGRTFLQNLDKGYGLLKRVDSLRSEGWLFMDDDQFQYLSSHIAVPLSSNDTVEDPKVPVSGLTSAMDNLQMDEDSAFTESKISQIKDIFPDYGKGFLSACLDVYNQNAEEVIQRILEGTLHKDLLTLDTSMDKIPAPNSGPALSRTDKGKGALVEPTVTSSSNVNKAVESRNVGSLSSSSSPSSHGRFVRKSKNEVPDREILDQKPGKDSIKTAVLASQYEYEDEYDDSFDELGLSLVESVEEAETLGDRLESGQQSGNSSKTGKWNKKPQFFVKDGKNYSYKVSGSVAVSSVKEAAMLADMPYGLGPGGNIPLRALAMINPSNEEDDEVPEVSDTQERGKVGFRGRGRGRGRGQTKEQDQRPDNAGPEMMGNPQNVRGRGRGRGGAGNHHRKDRAMKKHFSGLTGY
ncbi:hypothetical protein H6P81_020616 [Aristolochia fimbriata]|uniref:CUE domain-containing protein n=1 Tax=Aristolochia fimbriata TaxID=158543 RepID=A0AAV7DW32_ARIFI|nr:hypothetical protein H6P81_020616 [Aristolochia fimbriata]